MPQEEVLLAPLVTLLVMGTRRIFPRISGKAIVLATPFIGVLLTFALNRLSSSDMSPEVGAAMGALGTYLHQIGKQWKRKLPTLDLAAASFVPDENCKVLDDVWSSHEPRHPDAIKTTCSRCGKPLVRA
jgi:hypothetical protein